MIHWLVQTTDAHPALAQGVPPPGMLGQQEVFAFAGLKTEKRRRDWLLGRWTAKHLLQQMVRERCGTEVPLAALQVLNGRTHAPVINCELDIDMGDLPAISISHSNHHAFCAALPRQTLLIEKTDAAQATSQHPPQIGADIEQIVPRSAQFVQDYFTLIERTAVQQAAPEMTDVLVTAIWSAKEAALKALQLGLTVDTHCVTCAIEPLPEPPQAWTPFPIELDTSRLQSVPLLQGWWRVMDGFVLTLAA